jgi:PadR family transcriptional regulator, regulatory protein PadR
MSKGDWLGEFEQTVMLAVLRLGDDAYGMEVRREIAQRTGRESSIGAVYATLERLQDKGFMNSREIEPETEKGRARRAYRVTADGVRSLQQALSAISRLREGVRLLPGQVED